MTGTELQPVRLVAFATGLVAVLFLLAGWQVDRGRPPADTLVRVAADAHGGLSVTGHRLVFDRGLAPGRSGTGTIRLANGRSSAADVHVRAAAPAGEVGDAVHIAVRAGADLLYRGTVAGLRDWSVPSAHLAAGGRVTVRVRVWVPPAAGVATAGGVARLRLELDAGRTGEGALR